MKNPEDLPGGRVPRWTLGDRLRKARAYAGVEREEMADELGVTERTISSYELDQTLPKKVVVKAWALRTGVALDWLMGENFRPEGSKVPLSDCYPVDTALVEAA